MLKVVCWAGSVPFPPVFLQRQVVCLLLQPVFMCSSQGRAYTVSWLVGTNKSYVIAISDLWLFIHASNLLPLNSPPHSPTYIFTPQLPTPLPYIYIYPSTPHPTPLHIYLPLNSPPHSPTYIFTPQLPTPLPYIYIYRSKLHMYTTYPLTSPHWVTAQRKKHIV